MCRSFTDYHTIDQISDISVNADNPAVGLIFSPTQLADKVALSFLSFNNFNKLQTIKLFKVRFVNCLGRANF